MSICGLQKHIAIITASYPVATTQRQAEETVMEYVRRYNQATAQMGEPYASAAMLTPNQLHELQVYFMKGLPE